jgi:7-carboxy-7-deazaguanine synthase
MPYRIHAIHYTLQGEGVHAGRPAVLCRFQGCNLWSGREADRGEAVCRFCDTVFTGPPEEGGGAYGDADSLADTIRRHWPSENEPPFVLLTGGEPLLQLDAPLLDALHARGCFVAVETNGTLQAPWGVDWLCVSPKAGAPFVQARGDELKLVYPQEGLDPAAFRDLPFAHFVLQPRDDGDAAANAAHTNAALAHCLREPRWRLGLQLHKWLRIP